MCDLESKTQISSVCRFIEHNYSKGSILTVLLEIPPVKMCKTIISASLEVSVCFYHSLNLVSVTDNLGLKDLKS